MIGETFEDLALRYKGAYLPALTLAIILTSFTMMTYGTIVTVAVPNVMGAFGIGQDKAQLMATGFYIAMTTSQLICAWLIFSIGHYSTFFISIIFFALACFLGAFAESFDVIILSRVIQGASAGILMSQTMIAIVQAYPASRRGFALTMFTSGGILAIGIGPLLGGIIIETLSWRHIFLIPLPLLLLAFLIGIFVMPKSRRKEKPRFDWCGLATLTISLYCFMTIFADGQRQGWISNSIITLTVIGVISGIIFIYIQINSSYRLLNLTFFKYPVFIAAVMITFCVGMGNFGAIYAVPIFAQIIQNFSPVDAGLIMLPASILTIIIMPVIGRFSDAVSPRYGAMIGLGCFFLGTVPLILADFNTSYLYVMSFVILSRLGMGINNPVVAKAALSALPTNQIAEGTSTLNFFRMLGTSLGTTSWVVFLEIRTQYHSNALSSTQDPSNQTSREFLLNIGRIYRELGLSISDIEALSLIHLSDIIYLQSNKFGFQDGFTVLSAIFIIAMIPAYLIGKKKY
jgi:DHA2 family multidrug resistance protein